MTDNNSIDLPKASIADAAVNTNITSMTGITTTIGRPTFIDDANSNHVLSFSTVAAAVNNLNITNASIGTSPILGAISTTGVANVPVTFQTKATGSVIFKSPGSAIPTKLIPNSGSNSFYVAFNIPTITNDNDITWPDFTGFIQVVNIENSITAFAGGGQANAYTLNSMINRVSTVASANDSIKLPATYIQLLPIYIRNDGANSLNLYPKSGGTINSLGANNPLAIAAGVSIILFNTSTTASITFSSS